MSLYHVNVPQYDDILNNKTIYLIVVYHKMYLTQVEYPSWMIYVN